MQFLYGTQIRGLIYDLLKDRYLLPDGGNGKSLLDKPVPMLVKAIDRAKESNNKTNFKNNSALLHSAVFGFIKDKTQRTKPEHTEQQYLSVKILARNYLSKLQYQLEKQK